VTNPTRVNFTVNGVPSKVLVEPRRTLADCLRHDLNLTGTHVGCEHGVCGACTVIVDGDAVRSCLMLAVQAEGCNLATVESLGSAESLSVLQQAFQDNHALQCGFCTPGILMTAHALLGREPRASDERITEVLSGNICRCTGYIPIVKAIAQARNILADASRGPHSEDL
jgi:aerobic-type carbon monoxide dehydrogenase small subunit (CoxS/CutS family)